MIVPSYFTTWRPNLKNKNYPQILLSEQANLIK